MVALALVAALAQVPRFDAGDAPAAVAGPCLREWRRPLDAPAQVAWCGRAVLAENLLLPAAEPLFAQAPGALSEWALAVAAAGRSRVAGGLVVAGLGLSLTVMIGGLSLGGVPGVSEPLAVALGATALALGSIGTFAAFVVHAIASAEALAHLEAAVAAL